MSQATGRPNPIIDVGPDPGPAHVITLVHGTWARNAPWTRPDSPLCKTLHDHLNRPHVCAFAWSGRNTHKARLSAAVALTTHLRSLQERFPRARHHLVGHSHGGNVCLYALRDDALRKSMSGIICLSTPFLVARARNRDPFGDVSLLVVLSSLIVAAPIAYYSSIHITPPVTGVIGLVLALGAAAQSIGQRLAKSSTRWLTDLKTEPLPPSKLLIIRYSADEASAALLSGQFAAWIANRLCFLISNLSHGAYNPTIKPTLWVLESAGYVKDKSVPKKTRWPQLLLLFVAPFLPLVAFYVWTISRHIGPPSPPRAIVALAAAPVAGVTIPLAVALTCGLLAALLSLALSLVLCAMSFPSGVDLALLSPFIEVSAETAPEGVWQILQLVPENQGSGVPKNGLMHSASYTDPRALRAIARWIASRPPGIT